MKTALKVNRRELDKDLHSEWQLWAVDNNKNYPEEPSPHHRQQSDFEREHHNWTQYCLEMAGLDWPSFYKGPGQLFADEVIVHVAGSRILFIQRIGFDV